jgi:hypothetical protein
MNLKMKRILNGKDLPPRVCFCHSKSIFFGNVCPYCRCETATCGAFYAYPWRPLFIGFYFFKTLLKLIERHIKGEIEK